jgi:hypothetical protein
VIDIHSAFSQHLLQLTVTDAVFAVPAYGPQNDVTLKMPAFEWVHVQLHQQGDDKFITTDYLQQCPCYYLARRFGREDDVEYINFMNSGMSRSEMIHNGDKSRPQSHQWNPFCYSTEAFVAETMQSMLPTNVQGGEWQSRAIAMNKALVFGTKFYCVRENKTMSLQLLREVYAAGETGRALLPCRG